ncbi:target of rapamycin complex subunit LST8-like [Miscanthus floridulus]|uniref:target of rapamycin complex subunit LST8-like n=1 Tax=Miscanthus floridulus TaxID=154761 RepID=UPI00345B3AD3
MATAGERQQSGGKEAVMQRARDQPELAEYIVYVMAARGRGSMVTAHALWSGDPQRLSVEASWHISSTDPNPNPKELISGDQNGNIRVWDLAANSCSCELVPEVDTAVRSLTVMWDGSMVVAANNHGTCYVWRLLKGTQTITYFEPLHKLQAHDGYILKCLLSPEFCDPNRYLAIASSDHTVKIWNVDGFKLERTLVGHQRWVWDCVFSVDGAYLITASSDTTARLWTMSTEEAIRVYHGHHKATVCCALHDGAESAPS